LEEQYRNQHQMEILCTHVKSYCGAQGIAQVVEHLPQTLKALSLNPSVAKTKVIVKYLL
jgi:hypothetical protein